ncbi:hypothetical protein J4G08_00880 [Candidatus Poribacteria bacterium]|nr:hypothetical protein [Candidatus Poribacteria bacterium]
MFDVSQFEVTGLIFDKWQLVIICLLKNEQFICQLWNYLYTYIYILSIHLLHKNVHFLFEVAQYGASQT